MSNAEGNPPIRLAVVGGGTAGWLSALILQTEAKRLGLSLKITLIESSNVPPIGVGEGTTAIFGAVLQSLGIDQKDFLSQTDATIKYGIRHRDWRRLGHHYDGPIDDPYALSERIPGAGAWLHTYSVASGRPVSYVHIFNALMAARKAPVAKVKGRELPVSAYQHAFHFDQAKVGAYLRKQAVGIATVDAIVLSAARDPDDGNVTALFLDTGEELPVDFAVDCTGFRRTLIQGVMGAGWESYGDALPVNRAMPFWLDLDEAQDLPPFTLAWAQKSGWMWQIPTQGRIGCGYAYSDRHVTPDQAQAEIETALGHPIEPRNDIPIESGRLTEVWRGNVLALGLASNFLEPLEATSIHGTIVSLLLFTQRHLAGLNAIDAKARDRYNAAIAGQVDDFRDFINLHYVSERDDSPFWRDVAKEFILPQTRARLANWKARMPGPRDFQNDLGGLPHVEELLHYPVLDGLGLLSRDTAKAEMAANPKLRAFARKTAEHLAKESRRAAIRALSHRAWLRSIRDANPG